MSNFLVGATSTDIQVDTFTGDNSTTGFTLTGADGTTNSARVDIDGVVQKPSTDYSISGTTLTFVAAPPSGTGNITVAYTKAAIVNTPADVSVTTAKIATNNIDETLIKDAFIADFTEVTVAAGDSILLGDVDDSGNTKRDTVQGILDLVPSSGFTEGTLVTLSSTGTTFGSIPAGVSMIVINFNGVSTASGNTTRVRIGDSGGIETSGYLHGSTSSGNITVETVSTVDFTVGQDASASDTYSGSMLLTLLDAATFSWTVQNAIWDSGAAVIRFGAGGKSLSAELTQVQIFCSSTTFDAGTVNIMYQ